MRLARGLMKSIFVADVGSMYGVPTCSWRDDECTQGETNISDRCQVSAAFGCTCTGQESKLKLFNCTLHCFLLSRIMVD